MIKRRNHLLATDITVTIYRQRGKKLKYFSKITCKSPILPIFERTATVDRQKHSRGWLLGSVDWHLNKK